MGFPAEQGETMNGLSLTIRIGALLAAVVAGASEPQAPPRPAKAHTDAAAMEKGLADALRAFVVGDGPAARKALDAVEDNCRRLAPDEPGFPATITRWDGAFHGDLDATRELSARGMLDRAYDRFTFLPRGCLGCHAAAAKEGMPGLPGPQH